MARCIQLARNGMGTTFPNPMVGSVIVHNSKIIGEGWHFKAGEPHAEVNAINSVAFKEYLKDATIYVSLEPCSHFGKTPPCADLIIKSGIRNVVIGSKDPNPKVAGQGIQRLIEAGCNVTEGVLTEECTELNKRFFSFFQKKRPYIILKWAETLDGFIAPIQTDRSSEKKPVWVTNTYSRQLAHKLRAQEQAILVGTQTVLDDNPSLTTRDWKGNNPVRIVIDRILKIPQTASVFDGTVKTIVITEKKVSNDNQTFFETIDFSEKLPEQICEILYRHKLQSVIIEGGAKTLHSFIDANLWDEAYKFKGVNNFGRGIEAPKISGSLISERVPPVALEVAQKKIKNDIVQRFKNESH